MMVSNRGSFLRVLVWQWHHSLLFLACGVVAAVAHEVFGLLPKSFPPSPAAIVGAAVGIFASFRANAAYQRWWEGRGLWGRLVNASRMLSTQATTYLSAARAHRVVTRHALYVHVLRCQLRDDDPFADDHVKRLLAKLGVDDDTVIRYRAQTSLCHALVDEGLKDCAAEPELTPQRLQSLDQTFAAFLDVQGGCERIKRTPMPRGYAFFVERLIFIFAALFPLSVVADLSWFVIPLNLLVAMAFTLISETGRVLEDPFNWFYNSLPISQIAVNIERNTRQRIGETELPAAVVVDENGILY